MKDTFSSVVKQNIGCLHPMFVTVKHVFKDFNEELTQVLVYKSGTPIAQFYGLDAKINAQKFIEMLEK